MTLSTYITILCAICIVTFMALGMIINAGWRIRRKPPLSADDLFHPSHTPTTPLPEAYKIDWPAM